MIAIFRALQQSQQLRPVLDEIVDAQGGMEFHLLERVRLSSLDNNDPAEVRGRGVVVRQVVTSDGSGKHLADIRIHMSGRRGVLHTLESRIKLEPGRFIVMGQTAYNNRDAELPSFEDDDERVMLYYVVSAQAD